MILEKIIICWQILFKFIYIFFNINSKKDLL